MGVGVGMGVQMGIGSEAWMVWSSRSRWAGRRDKIR